MRARSLATMVGLLAATAVPASGQVFDFEDLAGQSGAISMYHDFILGGGHGGESWVISTGWETTFAVNSGSTFLWSNGGTWLDWSGGGTFDFGGAWLVGQFGVCGNSGLTQTVRGFRSAVEVYTATIDLSCTTGQFYTFDFADVDRIQFDQTNLGPVNLLVDDVTLGLQTEVVPEPISMVLLGTGLAGVGAAHRRRRKEGQGAAS